MSSLFTAQLYPNRALGFLVLGASLHDVLTRIKAEPQRFPDLQLYHSTDEPVQEPVMVGLPANGLRLRFDGPEQRLRLIEVTDFTKNHITFKDRDVVRPSSTHGTASPSAGESSSGPTFRHIYHRLLGPTYGGEYMPPTDDSETPGMGVYVLSYPGVAFTFPLAQSAYSPQKDVVSLLSASSSQIATSMAIFTGDSWADARQSLWTEPLPSIKGSPALVKGKDTLPDEISLIKIHGGGKLQLFRKWTNSSFWIILGDTTPQQLVAELGPPNAIYRKNDQRMIIHKLRTPSNAKTRPNLADLGRRDDSTDTDQSSIHTGTDDSDEEEAIEDGGDSQMSTESFYNYFHLGFDILVSTHVEPSRPPPSPSADAVPLPPLRVEVPDRQVATKLVLHGNIPGSYEFNRYRRCRWEISYMATHSSLEPATSETRYEMIERGLTETWKSTNSGGEPHGRQRGMVLNRGWGDSPSSSCELLGGWEESGGVGGAAGTNGNGNHESKDHDTTTLYGFPGLVFEVLRNGLVNTLTVF